MKRATRTTDSIPTRPLPGVIALVLLALCFSSSCQDPASSAQLEKHSPSVRVTLGNIHHVEAQGEGEQAHEGGSITWSFEGGGQLRLDRFLIVVSDIELHACLPTREKT